MEKYKILFVCKGNICRSPSAEGLFRSLLAENKLTNKFEIDSAGTLSYHSGELPDARMREHASKRGYNLISHARQIDPKHDFDYFDLIVAMDDENIADLKTLTTNPNHLKKIVKMTDYSREWSYDEVPDPYYGGEEGFELVLDLLEDATVGLLEKVKRKGKELIKVIKKNKRSF